MELKVGDIVDGVVSGIQQYGIFVKLQNGQVGLVHISEIRNEFIINIGSLFTIGDKVKVKIIEFQEGNKVCLSIKKAKTAQKLDINNLETESGFDNIQRILPKMIKKTYDDIFKN